MNDFRIPLGTLIESFIEWITVTFGFVFAFIRLIVDGAFGGIAFVLVAPPFYVIIAIAAAIGFAVRGWKFAVGTVIGLGLILGVNQWENAMLTLALVLVASIIAIGLSVPLGILAAKSSVASSAIRPMLDFLQTMPAFVYLVPALILFRVGEVPGIVATIIFAMAPGVRLTELGIRGVDKEVVEAGQAFGASPWRILRQIQLPLATPTIMAGINQVIMLSLSMVVIAGMVGAGALGGEIVAALSRLDVALGFEAGLAVVILAIFLDRVTAALGNGSTPLGRILAARKASRVAANSAAQPANVPASALV
ncbi:proline/glycine betaine ABC transporter permease [Cryobacterium sp. TMS1-13-1]|uniref:ABC transporter permease n=1 Tax=Cryobacterium sp. TMS1-13-1 TaxID=1259220 RepID=UPI00106AEFB1|nr:ABC transporter permease subunit [Cryobacterium sp. TMS1-13-1]TFD19289.1 ABC transporter permease subunit [Cryobacterium sp. TMS1-13-1]